VSRVHNPNRAESSILLPHPDGGKNNIGTRESHHRGEDGSVTSTVVDVNPTGYGSGNALVFYQRSPFPETVAAPGDNMTSCKLTPGGHCRHIGSVAFSSDVEIPRHVVADPPMRSLERHDVRANGLAFSPDGRTLAWASGDNTIRLWDVGTGLQIQTLGEHCGGISAVAFSPDGKMLASACGDNPIIRLWDVATGSLIQTLRGQGGWASPGDGIFAPGADNTTQLCDAGADLLGGENGSLSDASGSIFYNNNVSRFGTSRC